MRNGRLANRIAVVTGSGTGLGKATALLFAREGAVVILCGRRLSQLEEVKKQIESFGGIAHAVRTDVSSEKDVLTLVDLVRTSYGHIHILINNTAVYEPAPVVETTLDSWNYTLQNNLTSAFLMTKACLHLMRKQKYGRIVNITSDLANGACGFAAYSASKAGLESLTRSIAGEEGGYDLLINLYNPGLVKTEKQTNGVDPNRIAPDLLRLVTLAPGSYNGHLFEAQDPA